MQGSDVGQSYAKHTKLHPVPFMFLSQSSQWLDAGVRPNAGGITKLIL